MNWYYEKKKDLLMYLSSLFFQLAVYLKTRAIVTYCKTRAFRQEPRAWKD